MTATTSRGVVATTALAASALLLTGCVPNAGSDASAQSICYRADLSISVFSIFVEDGRESCV